jgi:hypothetical protein
VASLLYLPAHSFWLLALVNLTQAAMLAPLADALALSWSRSTMRASPGAFEYGWVRGTGSAAFIAGVLVAGQRETSDVLLVSRKGQARRPSRGAVSLNTCNARPSTKHKPEPFGPQVAGSAMSWLSCQGHDPECQRTRRRQAGLSRNATLRRSLSAGALGLPSSSSSAARALRYSKTRERAQ